MLQKLLIANRGEVAIRVARAASKLGTQTVAVYSEDDAECLHVRKTDDALPLSGVGAAAYLDGAQLIQRALETGCDSIHPGYGFLSERADFARDVRAAGLVFVGPSVEVLATFGDKLRARVLAEEAGVPILRGLDRSPSAAESQEFFRSLGAGGAVMVKAAAGGGGRGMRVVRAIDELDEAIERCRSEALAAFGNGDVYLEEYFSPARHIEVQVIGDGTQYGHLWDRDCSVQRRRQKLIEIAPSPNLSTSTRTRLIEAATRLAALARLDSLSTIEFLVSPEDDRFAFIEANARLQVEHTATEELLGVDLVEAQLRLAAGWTLSDVGLAEPPELPAAFAVQVRINLETVREDGSVVPTGGRIEEFAPPLGRDVRVDTHGYRGYLPSPRFDSLLAKAIVSVDTPHFSAAAAQVLRSLAEFQIVGPSTNIPLASAIVQHPRFKAGTVTTEFLESSLRELLQAQSEAPPAKYFPTAGETGEQGKLVGTRVDSRDPLALFGLYDSSKRSDVRSTLFDEEDEASNADLRAPLQGTVVAIRVAEGDAVVVGEPLVVLDAMKMEHTVAARRAGTVDRVHVTLGDTVAEGSLLVAITPSLDDSGAQAAADPLAGIDLDAFRPDLAEVERRRAFTLDAARAEAIERHRKVGHRSTRENISDLVDADSFVEYGQLALEGYGTGPDLEELMRKSPGDGFVCGVGTVNGDLFGKEARCAVLSYDYTVYAGTQGGINHHKHDRMFRLAEQWKLPVIFFTEGGGGRSRAGTAPRSNAHSGMRTTDTFRLLGRLSGLVPLVAISAGRNFAGSAAILGPCDVVIATRDSNIGMGGPAVIEGGGLGVYRPEEIGPIDVMAKNGVVDIVVKDEAEGVAVAKKYLSYFQGRVHNWEESDQRRLRRLVPENRRQAYDVRPVIETLADKDSVLELRRHFGRTFITAFIRIEGRPIGIVANNPAVLGGAIDVDGSDKAARFMQLCDAFGIPILSLCDTPGMMVGPEAEEAAQVKHCSRLFVVGCNLSVPFMMIVLRKCYGLGGLAMGAGNLETPSFVVSWPTGEFAGMNLEGQIKLAYRNELLAITDLEERTRRYEELLTAAYDRTSAITVAGLFDLDDVIDPADSRRWIERTLQMGTPFDARPPKRRPCVDTW